MPKQRPKLVRAVLYEARALIHQLVHIVNRLHEDDEITASLRGVIEGLARCGPQTVPEMARARPVTRQHIQALVNTLLERGLVARVDNPAHRRSPLIRLTKSGEALHRRIEERERPLFEEGELDLPESDLQATFRTLSALRTRFASESWNDSNPPPREQR